jgi:hypothetical protein
LPDVSFELPVAPTEKKLSTPDVGYRFDPPQMAERGWANDSNDRASQFRTLKSELVYAPGAARSLRPHVFDKSRVSPRRKPARRRESPILPRANSFAIPRRGLLDSLGPVFRFATLVALFTAAGTWAQLALHKIQPIDERVDTAKISDQRSANAALKNSNHPTQTPTAVGPAGTAPESGTRVGRVREKDDFATLRGDILPIAPETVESSSLELSGPSLPRLQITEAPKVATQDEAANHGDAHGAAEVARIPGFSMNLPSR